MKFNWIKPISALCASALVLGLSAPVHAEKTFQAASTSPSSTPTVLTIALTEILKKKHGYGFQIATGAPATRMAVDAANNNLDLFVTAVNINEYMKNGEKMFAKLDNAKALFGNLRGIINYPLGAYQPVVWADSGITTFADIKGKKVFTGPPSGAARSTTEAVIEGMTGFKPNAEYVRANLDWTSSMQAFRDRQIDVLFLPTSIPSPELEELAAVDKIRILSIEGEPVKKDVLKRVATLPGKKYATVPVGTYANLVNTAPAKVMDATVGLGTNKWMSEEAAYNITRAIFENKAELVAAGKWMQVITPESAIEDMNMPLHKGAAKYYREIGVTIPDAAKPVD